MDVDKPAAGTSLESRIRSSFPPLDPNGQPFSMILRGDAADLGELRSTLASSHPDARRQLQLDLERSGDDQFGDVDVEGSCDAVQVGVSPSESNACTQRQVEESADISNGNEAESENKKRTRADDGDGDNDDDEEGCDDDDDASSQEQLILYLPSIQCSCSSLNMKAAAGDILVTTLRVLFLAEREDNDVAIDGGCIALHAVDSLPGEYEEKISHHVYCQLAEPMADEGGMGCATAMSMAAHAPIDGDNVDEGSEQDVEEDQSAEEDGTMEVYFKPIKSDNDESQSNECQKIFDSLTTLASLNPVGDSEGAFGGGGLFSMLSMMAGIDGSNGFGGEMMMVAGQDDDSDDDMVVRLGGNNNLIENDDDSSEGAPEGERQAMLQRLDDMLVVPPEYEIASSDDGQFDDADEDIL